MAAFAQKGNAAIFLGVISGGKACQIISALIKKWRDFG